MVLGKLGYKCHCRVAGSKFPRMKASIQRALQGMVVTLALMPRCWRRKRFTSVDFMKLLFGDIASAMGWLCTGASAN